MDARRSAQRTLSRVVLTPASAALSGLAAAVGQMDYSAAQAMGRSLGTIWYHALPIRRRTVTEALARTFPNWSPLHVERTARSVFRCCASAITGLLWATADTTGPSDILEVVRFDGLENYERAARRGVVAAVTHTGSWDLAGLAAAAMGVDLTVVSRNLSHGPLDRMWMERRARTGVKLLDESHGLESMLEAAGPGKVLGVVMDQRTGPELGGTLIPFMGREAWTTTLPAAVALRRNLAVLPILSRLEPDGTIVVRVGEAVDPGAGSAMDRIHRIMLCLNRTLEGWLWQHPDSWLWLHRRWAREARRGRGSGSRPAGPRKR
jgi:KDO2-lipid IV(A) lauroyltransferase